MKIRRFIVSSTASALLLASAAVLAHHSVAGQFDVDQRVTLNGVISDIEWINPHIYIHLDVKDETGDVRTWRLESVPPSYLRKSRITRDMLMGGGAEVAIDILLAHDGTPGLGFVRVIHYPDGHEYQLAVQ
jgi:hypothetical protein